MNKTRLLTSMAVFGIFTIPAMADIASNAESATCDSGTIGVSSGSTVLEALWTAQSKNCDAGTYLNSTTANCTPCPAGSFCAGGTYTYNGSNIGITNACPTNYNSDEGASAQTDCYRSCTTSDVAHSTSVSGRYYYGDNNQCVPTSCDKGYSNVVDLTQYITAENIGDDAYCGKRDVSWRPVYGVGSLSGESCGLTENNTWKTDLGFGTFYGNASCNATPGSMDSNGDHRSVSAPDSMSRNDTSGRYCWCQLTDYEDINGNKQSATSSWVFADYYDNRYYSAENFCPTECSANCAQLLRFHSDSMFYQGFRYQLLKTSNTNIVIDECKINTYACNAGTYLDNSTETCVECPAGSFCAGGDFTYNGSDQGREICSGEYNLSDAGSISINDCYRSCATTDIAHSESVSGKYYYGDNNQCAPATCAAGYTVKEGIDFSNLDYANMNRTNSAYVNGEGVFSESGTQFGAQHDAIWYDMTSADVNTWGATFEDFGVVKGQARCSTISGNEYTTVLSSLTDETGNEDAQYCYCNLTGYRATGESSWTSLSSSWVFHGDNYSASHCADYCAHDCASYAGAIVGVDLRSALFSNAYSLASCEANTINIDWYNLGSLLQSNSCTYGQSDIVIPEVPERTGYDFGGWKVVE